MMRLPIAKKIFLNGIFGFESIFSVSIAVAALHMCFFVLVPVTLDRSVSTYLLARINDSAQLNKSQLRDILVTEYIDNYDAVGRRIDEQLASKNIIEKEGKYELTEQGIKFIGFSKSVARMYNLADRYNSKY